jgi:hypothetical protein
MPHFTPAGTSRDDATFYIDPNTVRRVACALRLPVIDLTPFVIDEFIRAAVQEKIERMRR